MGSQSRKDGYLHTLERANEILQAVPLIDGHNDWPWNIRGWFANNVTAPSFDLSDVPIGQTDLERLRLGHVGGQFWSAFVPCPKGGAELSEEPHLEIMRKTLQQIDLIRLMIENNPTRLGLATNATEVWDTFRSGRLACLIGIEGLHQIGNSLSVLRLYRSLGVRYVTMTHNKNNLFADSATAETQAHGGLSERGRIVVREMNRVGLIVDLSHSSEEVQRQVLAISQAPVIFSHSSCYFLCPHPRNTSDKILDKLKQNGGIMMICFLRELVKSTEMEEPTLSNVVDHIIYAGERIGYEHVGIGSDFDGMLKGPDGLDEVSDYPRLIAMLLDRGLSEDQVKLVAGLNILRVLREVDDVARRLQESTDWTPACDPIMSPWTELERKMVAEEGIRRKERRGK